MAWRHFHRQAPSLPTTAVESATLTPQAALQPGIRRFLLLPQDEMIRNCHDLYCYFIGFPDHEPGAQLG